MDVVLSELEPNFNKYQEVQEDILGLLLDEGPLPYDQIEDKLDYSHDDMQGAVRMLNHNGYLGRTLESGKRRLNVSDHVKSRF